MIGHGATLEGSDTGTIGEITAINIDGIEAAEIDVTTMDSPNAHQEFIAGLINAGSLSMDLKYEASNFATIQGAVGGSVETWTITFPDGAIFYCDGYISSVGAAVPHDADMTQTMNIKLTGEPDFSESGSSS